MMSSRDSDIRLQYVGFCFSLWQQRATSESKLEEPTLLWETVKLPEKAASLIMTDHNLIIAEEFLRSIY